MIPTRSAARTSGGSAGISAGSAGISAGSAGISGGSAGISAGAAGISGGSALGGAAVGQAESGKIGGAAVFGAKHPQPRLGHGERVLEMRANRPVNGFYGPIVGLNPRTPRTQGHNRFHGQHEARHDLGAPAGTARIRDIGRLMHGRADTVTGVFTHHTVLALGCNIGADRMANIADAAPEPCRSDPTPQRGLGNPQ